MFGPDAMPAGRTPTMQQWMKTWLEQRQDELKPSTWDGYESHTRNHIVPRLGHIPVDKVTVTVVSRFFRTGGMPPATKKAVHRVLSTALQSAKEQGLVSLNVARLVKVEAAEGKEVNPPTLEEATHALQVANATRMPARWHAALVLGLRQSEALALQWSDIDLEDGVVKVRCSLNRPRWRHGCGDATACPAGAGHPVRCPKRWQPPIFSTPKTSKGERVVTLPAGSLPLFVEHRKRQVKRKMRLGDAWTDLDLVFCTDLGTPIDQRNDHRAWKNLLAKAGIAEYRLHDARHFAATAALLSAALAGDGALQNVPDKAFMDRFGWSSTKMLAKYQHPVDVLQADLASRMDRLLFGGAV